MNPTPNEINIHLHIPGLFASFPYQWLHVGLSTKNDKVGRPRHKKRSSVWDKTVIRSKIRYDTDFGIIREFKTTVINLLIVLMEK